MDDDLTDKMDATVARQMIRNGNRSLPKFLWVNLLKKPELMDLYLEHKIIGINDRDTLGYYALECNRTIEKAKIVIERCARLMRYRWSDLFFNKSLLSFLLEREIVNIDDKDSRNMHALHSAVDIDDVEYAFDIGARQHTDENLLFPSIIARNKNTIELLLTKGIVFSDDDYHLAIRQSFDFYDERNGLEWYQYIRNTIPRPYFKMIHVLDGSTSDDLRGIHLNAFKYILRHEYREGIIIPPMMYSRNHGIKSFYNKYLIFILLGNWGFDCTVRIPGMPERQRTHRTLPDVLVKDVYRMLYGPQMKW